MTRKPLRWIYQRQDSAVRKWLEIAYPEVDTRAKTEKVEIHWEDEAWFRSDHQAGISYSPKGLLR